ncbi:MAG: hypothetical protein Ta2D_03100 [Rickettsiales bacterium]|nr:MAG: hypothetical protein Ta2D_03100 [Rickettsiales bacterium]
MKFLIIFLLLFSVVNAKDSLLYLEAQGIVGNSSQDGTIYRSGMPSDDMQLNSVGFDYIKKLSTKTGDIGTFALQTRVAYNKEEEEAKLQVYNAFLKIKTGYFDIWGGHDKTAFGLSSYLDNHGDLLQPLSMYGVGFDRDWGGGVAKDFDWGDAKIAYTTGSRMDVKDENRTFTARTSLGVLNYDNYNIGISILDDDYNTTGGVDFAYNYNNLEQKGEIAFNKDDIVYFYRLGVNFLDENALKLEGQVVYKKQNNYTLGAGITYRFNGDLTFRGMYEYSIEEVAMKMHHITTIKKMVDKKVVGQFYYYFGIL